MRRTERLIKGLKAGKMAALHKQRLIKKGCLTTHVFYGNLTHTSSTILKSIPALKNPSYTPCLCLISLIILHSYIHCMHVFGVITFMIGVHLLKFIHNILIVTSVNIHVLSF